MTDSDATPVWRKCDVSVTLEVIGGRWKPVILFSLLPGPRRFSEIQRYIPGVSQKMLTAQLRELEASGAVSRHVHGSIPPKVEYSLTEIGRSLEGLLLAMREWGAEHRSRETAAGNRAESPVSPEIGQWRCGTSGRVAT